MSGPTMMTDEQSAQVQALADTYVALVGAIANPLAPPDPGNQAMFTSSIAVQGILRAMVTQDDTSTQAVLCGVAEGFGMILGLIEDPIARAHFLSMAMRAINEGITTHSRIHTPDGSC